MLDRLIQQSVAQVLTPIFDPEFSESSFGFRSGRSAKDAVRQVREYIRQGYRIAVDKGRPEKTRLGVPQGGPLSPLLANILLDALDKELEKRGHKFVRYADDCAPRTHRGTKVLRCGAARKMRDGPSEPACRSRLQTTVSCIGKEPL